MIPVIFLFHLLYSQKEEWLTQEHFGFCMFCNKFFKAIISPPILVELWPCYDFPSPLGFPCFFRFSPTFIYVQVDNTKKQTIPSRHLFFSLSLVGSFALKINHDFCCCCHFNVALAMITAFVLPFLERGEGQGNLVREGLGFLSLRLLEPSSWCEGDNFHLTGSRLITAACSSRRPHSEARGHADVLQSRRWPVGTETQTG